MLHERKGSSCVYDVSTRTARVEVSQGRGTTRESRGAMLLDARGSLVGVDVEPHAASRIIVMLGRHEDVARAVEARLSVSRDDRGEVTSVVVHEIDPPR